VYSTFTTIRHTVVQLGKALASWLELASLVTKPDVNTNMAATTLEVGSDTSEI
jgi:hypothetical protein